MSDFPRSPRLLKGAIIGKDPANPLAIVVIFQYNPDTLTRTIQAQTTSSGEGGSSKNEAMRLKGPPLESIKIDVEIDATDQLEQAMAPATSMGVHPALASLEMLLYPKSALVIVNEVLMRAGVIEIIPPEAPLTLFVWGPKRILPVRISSLNITEEAFDTDLNPIRAKVSLEMQVLTYHDLGLLSPGGSLFMVHQVIKETMATINGAGSIASGDISSAFSPK
ncbi:hypothetical protein [Methanothrix soehngenii]|mgnify:CR=1 FL=1|jgi:hypothetical protein|nr:hypothetical protein [Methanothrix soehngenii]HOS22411.1 hypothetical protein [Methanothrix soehngenii]HPL20779.1 hypothetical protein [Methanothrix soehngenii]